MSDVFISYAREDQRVASRLAARLKSEGWTVFWDSDLRTGDDWRKVVENEVKAACCVVVLWSKDAIGAHWVQEEAEVGRERNVLLPALLDGENRRCPGHPRDWNSAPGAIAQR